MTSTDSAVPQSAAPAVAPYPPGPRGFPVLGSLPSLLRDPMVFLTHVAQKYGGIARIPIRRKFLYVVSDPAILRELLVTQRANYTKNYRYRHVQVLLGQGLLLSEGDEWRRQRLMTQPAFKAEPVNAQVGWMSAEVEGFLDKWRVAADQGTAIDVEPEFSRLAQVLAGRFLFGPGFEAIAEQFCAAASAVKKNWPTAPRSVWGLLKPASKQQQKQFDAAITELDQCFYAYLAEHRKTDFADCAVLTLLVRSACAEGKPLDDRQLRDQLFTLFFAGHETSATALCWIHYLLARNAPVRERLFREVESVLAGRLPTPEDLEALTYTHQVVQESLRLYSPIHSLSRVATADSVLGGYRIPAGATVCVSMYAVHRLPQFWPDPERFDPERFTPEQCAARPRFAYLPFAAGHRNCIGGGQAILELKMIVAQIAQRYRLELSAGQKIERAAGTTMYPRYGMRMTVQPRSSRDQS
jgi:cytochrome P450